MLSYLQFLHINTGVIRKTLSICYLDICLLKLTGQIIAHLREKEREMGGGVYVSR